MANDFRSNVRHHNETSAVSKAFCILRIRLIQGVFQRCRMSHPGIRSRGVVAANRAEKCMARFLLNLKHKQA